MSTPHILTAADEEIHQRRHRSLGNKLFRGCRKTAFWIPGFVWMLLWYLLLATQVADIRAPFVTFGTYAIAWVEVLYLVAFAAAVLELLKVSNPGHNDTGPALLMTIVLIAYIVLFTLGAAGVQPLTIFATSEFIVMTIVSAIQVGMAFWINGATLQRTIGHAGHDDY